MPIQFCNCEIDPDRLVLNRDGKRQPIEPQALKVLLLLIENRGRVVSRDELLNEIWGHQFVSDSTLSSTIKSARKAVADDGTRQAVIRTVRGVGYEFVAAMVDPPDVSPDPPRLTRAEPAGQSSALIGRDQVVTEIVNALKQHRLVTLVGPGGVGKTSLAAVVRERINTDYVDGTVQVELVRLTRPDSIIDACATALQVSVRREGTLRNALLEFLQARRLLLVFDNCEHLIEAVGNLAADILREAPRVTVLATSREAMGIRAERVWHIEPLSVDSESSSHESKPSVEALMAIPAVQLFTERAQAADPYFALNEDNAAIVQELCARLDGMPLAIELAASRTRAIGVSEIVRRLDERFRLLGRSRGGDDPRHRTLRDTVQWSFDLLEPQEKQLFLRLGVFSGQFDLDAATAVCAAGADTEFDTIDQLSRLVERCMVAVRHPHSGTARYELLDTMRSFGRQMLSSTEVDELRLRHGRFHRDLSRRVRRQLHSQDEYRACQQAHGAYEDLRQAFKNAVDADDCAAAIEIVCNLSEYVMRSMRYEVLGWADRVTGLSNANEQPEIATIYGLRAYAAWIRGEFQLAIQLGDQAEQLAGPSVDAPDLIERVRSNVYFVLGNTEGGRAATIKQLALAEESGQPSRIIHARYMQAIVLACLGDSEHARRHATEALSEAQRAGSPTDIASAYVAQGFSAATSVAALEAFAKADDMAKRAGNRWLCTFARTERGSLLLRQGNLEQARTMLAEAVDIWFRAGEWSQQWLTLTSCIVALQEMQKLELAARAIGALESRCVLGAPPVDSDLSERAKEAVVRLKKKLGEDHYFELTRQGAESSVGALLREIHSNLSA